MEDGNVIRAPDFSSPGSIFCFIVNRNTLCGYWRKKSIDGVCCLIKYFMKSKNML